MKPIQNIYIHVPFCKGSCSYCGFYKEPFHEEKVGLWLGALEQELATMASCYSIVGDTVYMGGGTPSLLSPAHFKRLVASLEKYAPLSSVSEWTIETTPESISEEKIRIWQQAGVNRISIGIQSLNKDVLYRMNRQCNMSDIRRAIEMVKVFFDGSLGLDLIGGFPSVTDDIWQDTLQEVVACNPDHISVYDCTLYPNSSLYQQVFCGKTKDASAEDRQQALQRANDLFVAAGYEQYEVSNYSKPGKRCRHNLDVWQGHDYLGIGPSASSRVGLKRWTNMPDVDKYIEWPSENEIPRTSETITQEEDATERIMFAFRLRDPVCIADYLPSDMSLSHTLATYWEEQLAGLSDEGLVQHLPDGWQTTSKGFAFADTIAEALLP